MCGIAGLVDQRLQQQDLLDAGSRMLEVMAHRGPDHRGTWCTPPVFLGHNRLSILDLSSGSHQPMSSHGLTITYNGEVYNYVELRAELESHGYQFHTTGDTEVILTAFRHWGAGCVERFIGMWAFAIWNESTQELFCSRDRFGIKPFHYILRDGRLHFASEIKGLRTSPLDRGGLNESQLLRGLYLGWMHHWDETSFVDIKSLPASHNLTCSRGEIRIWQYADIATQPDTSRSFTDNVESFRELFIDSIRLTSRRDVDMGVCLSGGLDSTSIASVLASSTGEHSVKTFTAYYTGTGNVDERPYIDHVLRRYPQIQQQTISPSDTDVAHVFDRVLRLMDAPMPSSSYISQYFVMQLAASHGVKVVLDGQGSDEIMGGYMHSLYRSIADYLRAGKLDDAAKELNHHAARQNYGVRRKLDVLAKSMLAAVRDEPALYRLELGRTAPWIARMSPASIPLHLEMPSGTRLNAFLYNLMRVTLLPTLLHTEDINSMAFSIESRVPFLDHRLVQLCFSMPNEHKIYRGETKRVLRAAMRGMVPDEVLDRKDKTGFITPGHVAWLRGALSHLLEGDWKDLDWAIDRTALNEVLSAYKRGDNSNALFVWRLAMLRAFIASR